MRRVLRDARILDPGPVGADGPPLALRGDLVLEDGRIAAVHPDGVGAPRGDDAETLDLEGRWVLPAFCDSHLHLDYLAQQRSVIALARDVSPDALAARLDPSTVEGEGWIIAQGWVDPLPERLVPSPRAFLDHLHPERPVLVFAVDHHRALLNSAALRAVGEPHHASHDGVLLESALDAAWKRVPPLPADVPGAVEDLHRFGIAAATSFDGTDARERWRAAARDGRLGLRLRHTMPEDEFLRRHAAGEAGDEPLDREAAFLVPWVKLFLDGTLGSRTAWMLEGYSDAPEERGDERIPEGRRRAIVDALAASGMAVCIHAIGDAAVRAATGVVEDLTTARGARVDRIEHAQLIAPEDLERIRKSGAVVSMQCCHLLEDASVAPERWGDRCRGAFAARAALDAGVPWILGSDAPIETADPWVDIRAAVDRVDRAGRFRDGWIPEQRVTFAEALRARTSAAAGPNILPEGWGRIRPGAPADLQVLECEDPGAVGDHGSARLARLLVAGEERWTRSGRRG